MRSRRTPGQRRAWSGECTPCARSREHPCQGRREGSVEDGAVRLGLRVVGALEVEEIKMETAAETAKDVLKISDGNSGPPCNVCLSGIIFQDNPGELPIWAAPQHQPTLIQNNCVTNWANRRFLKPSSFTVPLQTPVLLATLEGMPVWLTDPVSPDGQIYSTPK